MDVHWNNLLFTVKGLALLLAAWVIGELLRQVPNFLKARKVARITDMRLKGYHFAARHILTGGDIELLRSMTKHGIQTPWDDGILEAIADYEENQHGSQH